MQGLKGGIGYDRETPHYSTTQSHIDCIDAERHQYYPTQSSCLQLMLQSRTFVACL